MPEIAELGPITTRNREGVTTLVVSWGPLNRANRVKKRALDLALTIPALVVLLPLMAMVACAVKLASPGDRKRVVKGRSVSVRVVRGVSGTSTKKTKR